MSEPQDSLESAIERIGQSLALDLTYLAPPGERHFDPISAAEGLGSLLVLTYLNAFCDGLRHRASDLGESTASRFADSIERFFGHDRAPDEPQLADLADTARGEARKQPSRAADVDDAVEHALINYLTSRHLPDEAAKRIAALVRDAAELEPRGR
jgi:hypothetical protein